jgi:arylsulfatase A
MSRFSQIIACLALSVGCSTRGGSSTDATGGADALALLDNSVDGRASRPARDAAQAEQTSPDAGHVAFPARPNIILVYADDLGYGDLGSYGQSRISTPHLDRLAADGMRFTQFYSNCPYCYGARISMLTGQHLGASVRMREGFVADSPDAPRYLPRYLQNAGYATAIFGKWGFGSCDGLSFVGEKDPATVGFDVFLGYLTHRGAHTYTLPPYPLLPADTWAIDDHLWTIERGRTVEYPEARIPYTHELYVRETLAFIRSQQDRPFFLYLPYTLPHAELYVPDDAEDENLLGQYLGDDGKSIFPETPWRGDAIYRRPNERPRATYAAMVSRLDRDIGRIVAEVEALGLSEKTVIVVTSDNGPHEAGGIIGPEFFDSTGGLSGLKFTLREGGIRVPLIVYWPRSVEAGVVVTQPFAQEDLLPTFAELAGVAVTSPITGHSLVPLLRGASQEPHEFLYWQAVTNHFAGEAVRSGDWKAIRSGTDSSTDPVRLFDLVDDLREARDVAAENPALVAQLKRLMDRARTTAGGGPDGLYPITPFFSDRQQRTGTDGDDELGGSAEADEISGGGRCGFDQRAKRCGPAQRQRG